MMTIDQIREKLKTQNAKAVSEETGVSYETVRKLKSGAYKSCEYEKGRKLAEFLQS